MFTDVWAYGVLLYEMFTQAAKPYGEQWDNIRVQMEVVNGYRLPQPEHCPDSVYFVMSQCWNKEPRSRPDFEALLIYLQRVKETRCLLDPRTTDLGSETVPIARGKIGRDLLGRASSTPLSTLNPRAVILQYDDDSELQRANNGKGISNSSVAAASGAAEVAVVPVTATMLQGGARIGGAGSRRGSEDKSDLKQSRDMTTLPPTTLPISSPCSIHDGSPNSSANSSNSTSTDSNIGNDALGNDRSDLSCKGPKATTTDVHWGKGEFEGIENHSLIINGRILRNASDDHASYLQSRGPDAFRIDHISPTGDSSDSCCKQGIDSSVLISEADPAAPIILSPSMANSQSPSTLFFDVHRKAKVSSKVSSPISTARAFDYTNSPVDTSLARLPLIQKEDKDLSLQSQLISSSQKQKGNVSLDTFRRSSRKYRPISSPIRVANELDLAAHSGAIRTVSADYVMHGDNEHPLQRQSPFDDLDARHSHRSRIAATAKTSSCKGRGGGA